jgi:hypothetical protein
MKTLKILLSLFILLTISQLSFSQLRVNVTGGYQTNAGDFNSGFRHGYAFDASLRFNALKKTQWGISTGFYRTSNALQISVLDNQTGKYLSFNGRFIEQLQPIMIGFDHYLSKKRLKPHLGLEAGVFLTKYLVTVNENTNVTIDNSNSDITINYGGTFTFGILYDINDRIAFNTRLKYSGLAYANSGYSNLVGISTGLSFSIGK